MPHSRYDVNESDSQIDVNAKANPLAVESSLENGAKSTINGKANLIASGKFDKEMYDYLIFNIYVYRAYGYVAIEKYEHALDDFRRAKRITPPIRRSPACLLMARVRYADTEDEALRA